MFFRKLSTRRAICVLLESGIIATTFFCGVSLRFDGDPGRAFQYELLFPKIILVILVLEVCFYYSDLYEDRILRRWRELFLQLAQSYIAAILLLSLLYYALPELKVGRGILAIFLPLSFVGIVIWREIYSWVYARKTFNESVLILGTGATAQQVATEMLKRDPVGYRVTGFLGEHAAEVGRRLVNPSVVGTVDDLLPMVDELKVTLIVVALEDRRGKMPVQDLLRCRMTGVRVEEAPDFYERLTGRILVNNLRPSWIVFSSGFKAPRLLRNAKRTSEFLVAAASMVLLAPLFALVAIIIKLDSRGPVFYGQERVGQNNRLFTLFKFRTMRAEAEAISGPVWATADSDPRITRVGRWLRKTRLDELPQIINVLKGEMSFVGPRPERPHFVDQLKKIIPYYSERHSVKPGITGWAQVRFHYGGTIEDTQSKLEYDLYYIKHMSLILDIAVLIDTVKVMFLGKGAR